MFKKIASYAAGLYAVTLVTSIIRIGLKSLIAKQLGKEALGSYAYFMGTQQIGIALLAFGLNRTLAKHVASAAKEGRSYEQIVTNVIGLLTILSVILTIIALILNNYIAWIWIAILIGVGPATIFLVAQASLRGQFERNLEVIAAFFSISSQGVIILVAVLFAFNSQAPVLGLVLANLFVAGVILVYFINRQPETWHVSNLRTTYQSLEFRQLLGLAAPLWITDILAVIGRQADLLIVEQQLGYIPLAEYAAAFTFIGLLNQPMTVLSRMFLVTFSSGFYTDIDKYKEVSSLNLAFISTIGLGATVMSIPLTPLLFTKDYTLAPTLVAILSTAFVFKAIEVMNTALTIAEDYPHINRDSKFLTLLFYLPLAFLLVSQFGVIGAAISNVVSSSGYALIHAWLMRKQFAEHARHTYRECLIGTALYTIVILFVWVFESYWSIAISIPIYLTLGHFLKLWDLSKVPNLFRKLLPDKLKKS